MWAYDEELFDLMMENGQIFFGNHGVDTRFRGILRAKLFSVHGKQNDRHGNRVGSKYARRFQSVHLGHREIQDNQIWT